MDLHIPALRFPNDRVTYVGIDPPETVTSQDSLFKGENERGYGVWKADLYGVGDVLGKKRTERGWDAKTLEIVGDGLEDGVCALLRWTGGESGVEMYGGNLPWHQDPMAEPRPSADKSIDAGVGKYAASDSWHI